MQLQLLSFFPPAATRGGVPNVGLTRKAILRQLHLRETALRHSAFCAKIGVPDSEPARDTWLLVAPARATAEKVHRRVVDEVPNATADEAIGALVSLGGLDELLLNGADLSPHAAKPGVLLPIGTCHEAGVIWTKRGGEHACTPRPVHVDNLQLAAAAVRGLVLEQHLVNVFDVLAGHNAHLLTRVGDLGDRRDGPLIRLLAGRLNARVVAVTHRKDPGVALVICSPRLALASLHSEVHVLMAEDKRPQAIHMHLTRLPRGIS